MFKKILPTCLHVIYAEWEWKVYSAFLCMSLIMGFYTLDHSDFMSTYLGNKPLFPSSQWHSKESPVVQYLDLIPRVIRPITWCSQLVPSRAGLHHSWVGCRCPRSCEWRHSMDTGSARGALDLLYRSFGVKFSFRLHCWVDLVHRKD